MALKPLDFYQQWAVAGMQQDRYSQLPWIVESENIDITSQCIKASARSEAQVQNPNIIDIDHKGRFQLHSDGRVRDTKKNSYVTNNTNFSETVGTVNYGRNQPTNPSMEFWTPLKLLVEYDKYEDEYSTIVVFTDRMIVSYYRYGQTIQNIKIPNSSNYEVVTENQGRTVYQIKFKKNGKLSVKIEPKEHGGGKIEITIRRRDKSQGSIKLKEYMLYKHNYRFDEENDLMYNETMGTKKVVLQEWGGLENNTLSNNGDELIINAYSGAGDNSSTLYLTYETEGDYDGMLELSTVLCMEDRVFLRPSEKKFIEHQHFTYMIDGPTVRRYRFSEKWNKYYSRLSYSFIMDESYNLDRLYTKGFSVVWVLYASEQSIIFSNHGGNWYITQVADNAVRHHAEFKDYKFLNAEKIWEMIYIIAEVGGIVGLYGYYAGEMKKLVADDMVKWVFMSQSRYQFTGMMTNWRDDLYIITKDKKIFARKRTEIGTLGIFVGSIPEAKEVLAIRKEKNQDYLEIVYRKGTQSYVTRYMSDREDSEIKKKYNSDFSVTYPILINQHMLEKQLQELSLSAMLPNKIASFDLWVRVNDYHFWHFYGNTDDELQRGDVYTLEWIDATRYTLIYEWKTPKGLLFRLEGELPSGFESPTKLKKIGGTKELSIKGFDHFAYVGSVKSDRFAHKKEVFTSLMAKLNLPWIHTLQVKVDGHGSPGQSPELYGVYYKLDLLKR